MGIRGLRLDTRGGISLRWPVLKGSCPWLHRSQWNPLRSRRGGSSTKITFHQLATHTAGLIGEPKLKDAASGSIEMWEDKVLQSIPLTEITTKPGMNFRYSNIGYGILGLAISRAAGKSYEDLLKERIFQPLDMVNSFLIVPEEKMKYVAKGMDGGPMGDIDYDYPMEEHKGRGYKVPNGRIFIGHSGSISGHFRYYTN